MYYSLIDSRYALSFSLSLSLSVFFFVGGGLGPWVIHIVYGGRVICNFPCITAFSFHASAKASQLLGYYTFNIGVRIAHVDDG